MIGQHRVVDEARHGVLHHALFFGEQAADVVQVERDSGRWRARALPVGCWFGGARF